MKVDLSVVVDVHDLIEPEMVREAIAERLADMEPEVTIRFITREEETIALRGGR